MSRFQSVSYRRFAEASEPREPEPAQLEALIAKARGRARADGFEEGVAHAEAQRDAVQEETLRAIADSLAALASARDEMRQEAAAATFAAIREFIGGIAPRLLASGAAEAAAEALSKVIAGAQSPEVSVRVASVALTATRARLHAAGVRCELSGDPDIPLGVARITGGGGFDEIDVRAAVKAALTTLDRSAPAPRAGSAKSASPKRPSTLFSEDTDNG
ncbi:MAG: hypothetical protein AAFN79_09180 [Pseudomonadota bacterium]